MSSNSGLTSSDSARLHLAAQLRERIADLEAAIIQRLAAHGDVSSLSSEGGLPGINKVIRSALEYGIASIEFGERTMSSPPTEVLVHAREAAWGSVPVQTLVLRYFSGYCLFKDFLFREAESQGLETHLALRQVIGPADRCFELLIQVIGDEYQQEARKWKRSRDSRKLDRIKALLAGDIPEANELGYVFDASHIGIVGVGSNLLPLLKEMARSLSGSLLALNPLPDQTWAWIGTRTPPSAFDLRALVPEDLPDSVRMAIGSPAPRLPGWRHTHRQALLALPLTNVRERPVVHYSAVALLASALRDDVLLPSLTLEYLKPLRAGRDGGLTLRNTLRAYFSASGNVSSAAALLGVKRHTVTNRLRSVEDLLGRPLSTCQRQLELALELDALSIIPSQVDERANF
ncbi:MAG TPA: helix-turn-helix domain-containing protein [Solirubrobacterales bacterium]|nr:helix-turn-helix domain-containing protein [Solirubrobacterales bacterium]